MAEGGGTGALGLDLKLPRRLAWRIWRRANVGALVAAVTSGVLTIFTGPVYLGLPPRRLLPFVMTVALPVFAAASALGVVIIRICVDRAFDWLRADREPSKVEITRVAAIPRTAGLVVAMLFSTFAPVTFVLLNRWIAVPWLDAALTLATGITYGALTAAAITFLLAEQAVRPILSLVLPSDTTAWPRTIGMTSRLLLVWFMVSAAPVLFTLNIGRLNPAQRAVAGPLLLIGCMLFVVIGFLVFVIAGQAITGPLERIRTGLRAVAAGDLDMEMPATEAAEIGLLQVGFNQMVDGLRERERMREVFGRYVGTDVARLAMVSKFGQGGELCEATAMFVDIIGSTGLAQRHDPDAVVMILNKFFEVVVRVVASEGGFINKFQGDGALCLFGAPVAQPDHATRGLRAARALAHELSPLGDIVAAVGVSSGQVVAGTVGAADRYEFTVIGDPVNEAERLTEEAKLCTSHILASERTLLAAAGAEAACWTQGDQLRLRGRAVPTLTYAPATI